MEPGEPDTKLRGGYPGADTAPTRTFVPGEMVGSLEVSQRPATRQGTSP